MMPPDLELPDDVEALKAMVLAMAAKAARVEALEKQVDDLEARNADADERIERLTQILKAFDRARFGRRSEKLAASAVDDEQHAFVFEEIETGIAAIRAQITKGRGNADAKRAPRPRKGFAPHLERVEIVIEPEELPEHADKQKILIGEDVSERLDVVAAKFRVIVTRRPKYAFKNEDGVIQAAAPAHIIEGGIPTEALLAQIAVSKYADGLPLYRQEAIPAEQAAFDDDVDRLKDIALEAPIINFVAKMAQNAYDAQVTDIHIEPFSDRVQIRYRRDGVLSRSETVQKSMLSGIVTRIKILSGLNIVERRLPQDGRMRLSIRGTEIDFRVPIVPSMHGETIVLRLLRNLNVSSDLSALGFDEEARRKIAQLAQSSNGMVVVTGPTGSGKTTTLYSLVSLLNKEGVKIFTIEDPVEYQLEGITQLQVNSAIDLDFARSLRSVLRQDPDIILVGEIRDKETAQIAIQAALTGHLVLTTLHTNTAAGAFTRLRDMGIEEYLIASTIRGVIAQRLVRLLCPSCEECDTPECPACRGTRYSGRTVIYEVLEVGAGLSALMGSGATEDEIVEQAVADGMTTMAACASGLIDTGVTSKLEVSRVLNTVADR